MYKKNFKSATYLNLNILLTVFLNRAVILLLTFFLFFKFKKNCIIADLCIKNSMFFLLILKFQLAV